jgi:hypothetical protein
MKRFDCVDSMRMVRDKLSEEIADMNHEELVQWLRRHRYDDPVLQKLADKARGPELHDDPGPENTRGPTR